jgi:hypothetical protein
MERIQEEKAKAQECSGGSAWQVRLGGVQRGQAAGQRRERLQGRPCVQPQEDIRRAAQRPPTPARARFGDVAIGLGELGIRYRAAANR